MKWKFDQTFRRVSCGDGSVLECYGTDTETAAHNLRLASAAPDMLAALKWAASFIPPEKANCAETVRVAIAKAEGRAE